MTAVLDHLKSLYAQSDDPWHFTTSPYEQAKFQATRAALRRDRYARGLEIGCGNGELARHLTPVCGAYIGIDAIDRAVLAARRRVPDASFVQGIYPCPLPGPPPDLVILSEVLYFLTRDIIAMLARDIVSFAPGAEVICVTYLGDTAQSLQGPEAFTAFHAGAGDALALSLIVETADYRIDSGIVKGPAL